MNQQHLNNEELIDYLHGELSPSRDAALLAHLESCRECSAAYEAEANLTEALRIQARETERDLPQGVVARIWDAVEKDSQRVSIWEQIAAVLRPAVAVPAVAVLVVAGYIGVTTMHRGSVPMTINAAYYLDDHAALNSTVPFSEGAPVPASLERDETGSDQQWVAVDATMTTADAR